MSRLLKRWQKELTRFGRGIAALMRLGVGRFAVLLALCVLSLPGCSMRNESPRQLSPVEVEVQSQSTVPWPEDRESSSVRVTFSRYGADVGAAAASPLDSIIRSLKANQGDLRVVVAGFGDEDMPPDIASGLAERRANSVRSFLISQGVPRWRVATISPGEVRPREVAGTAVAWIHREELAPTLTYSWNAWTFKKGGSWMEPIVTFQPSHTYSVVVDLSHNLYDHPAVDRWSISQQFQAVVDEAVRGGERELKLQALVVTSRHMDVLNSKPINLSIDLDKLSAHRNLNSFHGRSIPLSAVELPDLSNGVIGRLRFDLVVGKEKGWGAFGISFWHEGRPIDELVVHRCIGETRQACSEQQARPMPNLGGSDLFDAAHDRSVRRPAAALQLIALSPEEIVGIFAEAPSHQIDTYHVWSLHTSVAELHERLTQLQEQFFEASAARPGVGRAIANTLFPRDDQQADAAYNAFGQFVERHRVGQPFADNRPLLFVRMLSASRRTTPLYPASLINLDGTDSGYAGLWMEIVSPLSDQRYGTTTCPSHWRVLIPRDVRDGALKMASLRLGHRLSESPIATWRIDQGRASVLENMSSLGNVLSPDRLGERARQVQPATLLSVVSHHAHDSLYFDTSSPFLASNVTAAFGTDSVAILAGCSTGQPGPGGIIYGLNLAGFGSIIATNTGVSGDLAGAMLDAMAKSFEQPEVEQLVVTELLRRSQKALYGTYGEEVLSFVVIGNPDAVVCEPQAEISP